MNRRSLFRGLLGAVALSFLPSIARPQEELEPGERVETPTADDEWEHLQILIGIDEQVLTLHEGRWVWVDR